MGQKAGDRDHAFEKPSPGMLKPRAPPISPSSGCPEMGPFKCHRCISALRVPAGLAHTLWEQLPNQTPYLCEFGARAGAIPPVSAAVPCPTKVAHMVSNVLGRRVIVVQVLSVCVKELQKQINLHGCLVKLHDQY
jgi:hypothetical protein